MYFFRIILEVPSMFFLLLFPEEVKQHRVLLVSTIFALKSVFENIFKTEHLGKVAEEKKSGMGRSKT